VTRSAQGDQVLFRIVAEQAPCLKVMNLKITPRTTALAAPSVSLEHPSVEFLVEWNIESQRGASQGMDRHEIPLTVLRNSCWFDSGSKREHRTTGMQLILFHARWLR